MSAQAHLIPRLLWASLVFAVIAFICSMILFGGLSLFITPACFVITLIFDITLLLLTAKEGKQDLGPSQGDASGSGNVGSSAPPLPHACRTPSIVLQFAITVFWMASLGMLLFFLVGIIGYNDDGYINPVVGAPLTEAIFVLGQIGVMASLGTVCIRERRRLVAQDGRREEKA